MNTVIETPMYGWNTIPWKCIQRNVFKLQKRIYRASCRGDTKTVRKLQRLLIKSWSARLIAVRRVTQENQGKKTAGVDGVKSLTPPQRLTLASTLKISDKAQPVRRVWIDKPGTNEKRPLGIPVIADRALQSLVRAALEPECEARFEPNSYGFRPGRSCHDAIEAIFTAINKKAKYVLDADIAKCFDRINHSALLQKVNTNPSIRRQLKAWLKAGVLEDGKLFPTEEGTMQGGNISPLLANIALHGLETVIVKKFPRSGSKKFNPPNVIRYADDFVILHEKLEIIKECHQLVSEWLREIGLELKPSKTRITHTLLTVPEGKPGYDFLGFQIRQYSVGKTKSGKNNQGHLQGFKTYIKPNKTAIQKHAQKLRKIIKSNKHTVQATLIAELNPIITGWANYYAHVVSSKIFQKLDNILYLMLRIWAIYRHPNKKRHWIMNKYWRVDDGKGWIFQPPTDGFGLYRHDQTPIQRHVKVKGSSSPYDGDWAYWSKRMGRHPENSPRIAKLMKRQQGKCPECGLFFTDKDLMEVDHIIPKALGGANSIDNLQLLHRHCHDMKTARDTGGKGTHDKRQVVEEPDEQKCSRPVL
jgi:RNA-directed DNA polymerase